ncbi:LOW QUALITY PROTEIN: Malonate-semialdehyde dehydrogenase 1 [Frankliniella fusca]|uniref:Malonate-semialdehyde dehydrogenase 1 n=1 Tax=Frankliniella fusca TaxID=407009 RepID=A0AAE1HBK9_9NEOP|nr:LOW QUALITY PROTEIN: Malonate-semialdehyde dehydrogenase 1 [Frankliniella fusca]
MSCNIDRSENVLWGKVQASQRQEIRNVKVFYSVDRIRSAQCSCPVGKYGKCHHIAALLLYGNRNISVTDHARGHLKRKLGMTMRDIPLTSHPPTRPHYKSIQGPLSEEEVREARRNLPSCKGAAVSVKWLTDPEPDSAAESCVLPSDFSASTPAALNIPAIEEALRASEFSAAPNKCQYLIDYFKLSHEDISEIAKATCGQTSVLLWSVLHTHCLTASNFGFAIRASTGNRSCASLLKAIAGRSHFKRNPNI